MKKWWIALLGILLMPFAKADVIMPFLPVFYSSLALFLFIPVVFIEGAIAYFLLKKYKVKFWYLILVFFIANLVSTLVGFLLSMNEFFATAIGIYGSLNVYNPIAVLILAILTILIEAVVIYLFLKKKIKNPVSKSINISLVVNVVSYLLIIVVLYFIWVQPTPLPPYNLKIKCVELDLEIIEVNVTSNTLIVGRGGDNLNLTGLLIIINGNLTGVDASDLKPLSIKKITLEDISSGDVIKVGGVLEVNGKEVICQVFTKTIE